MAKNEDGKQPAAKSFSFVSRSDGRSYREEKKEKIGQTLPRPRVK
jgi:hypothetical protein